MHSKVILLSVLLTVSTALTACGGRVPASLDNTNQPDQGSENPPTPPIEEPTTDPQLQEQAAAAWAIINADGDEFMAPEEMVTFLVALAGGTPPEVAAARVRQSRGVRTMARRPYPPGYGQVPPRQIQAFGRTVPRLRTQDDAAPTDPITEAAWVFTNDYFYRFDGDLDNQLNAIEFETGFITLANEGTPFQTYNRNPKGALLLRMRHALRYGR